MALGVSGFVFSLGLVPVQEWIAEARRSRDLKAGSAFLAYVMWRLLARLKEEGATVLLPWPSQEEAPRSFGDALEKYGIPNRASGLLRTIDADSVKSLLGSLQKAVEGAWDERRSLALRQELPRLASDVWPELAPHVKRYLERVPAGEDCPLTLVWVAAPVSGDLDSAEVRRGALGLIDRLYSDVKRTRPVRPWRHGSGAGKCNQCGKREAVGPDDFDAWRDWSATLAGQAWIERGVRIDPGERLCCVCLTKRVAGYSGDRKPFPSTGEIAMTPWIEQVEAQKSPSYLALMTFDGDNMGRWVHKAAEGIPERIATFAKSAKELLEKYAVFYLAGDEGLAMVPASRALDLASELRETFLRDLGEGPTLSVGLAFFEYTRPLRGAIEAARSALRQAKALEGKNALAVAVETASGNRWAFAAHWGDDWSRIRTAVDLVRKGDLSSGWAHDVESFLETIPEKAWEEPVVKAARAEVRRLLFRRLQLKGGTAEEKRANRLKVWSDLRGEAWWPEDGRGHMEKPQPEQFHLIGFLSRQAAFETQGEA
jgi:hypothetical protein